MFRYLQHPKRKCIPDCRKRAEIGCALKNQVAVPLRVGTISSPHSMTLCPGNGMLAGPRKEEQL